MKPSGISLGLRDGAVVMGLTHSSAAQDKIWEAVESAFDEGMTVKQFRQECAEAWEHEITLKKDYDAREWGREEGK